jgi:hypothetical protein
MLWYVYLGWFLAGAFLTNAIPHIVQGICGNLAFRRRSPRRAASVNPRPWSMCSGDLATSRSVSRCFIFSYRNCRRPGRYVRWR